MVQGYKKVRIGDKKLPVLYDVDAVVVGGSFAGVSAAKVLAENGKNTVLVEPRTYLGREVTATLRPWISGISGDTVPAVIEKALGNDFTSAETPLYPDGVKRNLEDALLDEKVELLYASQPVGLSTDSDGKKLLIIGNKSGRQVIRTKLIIDATETGSVIKLTGQEFKPVETKTSYRKTLEMYRTDRMDEDEVSVPESLGIKDNIVRIHKGYLENGHVYLEFELDFNNKQNTMEAAMEREIASRHTTIQLAEHFIHSQEAFKNAYLAASSYELQSPVTEQMKKNAGHLGTKSAAIADFASEDPRVWCLSELAPITNAEEVFQNPVTSAAFGEQFAHQLIKVWDKQVQIPSGTKESAEEPELQDSLLTVKELDQPQRGRTYSRKFVEGSDIPVLKETDVLVVGGGTSGANAAITAAREGMDTILLEMNPGLGGTATFGAVDSYWFGRRGGFNKEITSWVNDIHKRINHKSPKWNIEAKMYALLKEAEAAGVNTYFHAVTIGTIMEGSRVCGVVAASKWGTYAVLAETVIDASGDGDVAAFAGADYIYGSERDHIVMWYSLAQFAKPGRSQNNFTSMVHVSDIEDYTRAILAGRRRKRNRDVHDHGIYVASRETRHILGDVVMSLTDQLRHRKWEDVINIHFSNHDMKGKNGADWMHLGLIPPNLEIEVPYRMLLPKGLTGMIVAGKAISATHDGFAAIRMQADLENLGGVAALAAAQAVKNRQLPHEIDVKQLQKRLVSADILPEGIVERQVKNHSYTDEELQSLVDSLTGDTPLYLYADMEIDEVFTEKIPFVEVCTAGPRVIPFLKRALDEAEKSECRKRQLVLAQALAMYESDYGVPVLLREIDKALAGEKLPERDNIIRHTQLPPDQGAMPDVVYLIYTIGMTKDKRSLPVWRKIAERIDPSVENLKDMYKGTFYYIDAVCYGVERLADQECIPILEKLYAHGTICNQQKSSGFDVDYFKERQAMLDLSIARALARCGSMEGYRILVSYLHDNRSLLAEQAHTELVRITGVDHGKNTHDWLEYLENRSGSLPVVPVELKLDMEKVPVPDR
ncbi:FAD-dependent oxidoreductase [Thalassobacillus pellis]|uniref:FAD-dependent oxidoreductase n=1 Tax=Thalassobacillus pellis TaxID=748008 RepID=UPI0019615EB5|nr:FAD-dependent oxidoreductase [Thalassobacillus pellis]MBM7551533.1 ribulose 1,5-bisphosphate synthetase/thiazole synthase [Thalassobacillus pellis]